MLGLKKLNRCDIFIALNVLYSMQGLLYPSGAINQICQLIIIVWGLVILAQYYFGASAFKTVMRNNSDSDVLCLELMKDICRTLSANIPFLRVDLYVIDGKVYFGELTFYPASGIGMFKPKEWDEKFGKMIEIN